MPIDAEALRALSITTHNLAQSTNDPVKRSELHKLALDYERRAELRLRFSAGSIASVQSGDA